MARSRSAGEQWKKTLRRLLKLLGHEVRCKVIGETRPADQALNIAIRQKPSGERYTVARTDHAELYKSGALQQ